jgi:hypothetical protein
VTYVALLLVWSQMVHSRGPPPCYYIMSLPSVSGDTHNDLKMDSSTLADEALAYLYRQIDMNDRINPCYVAIWAQINAILQARSAIYATAPPPLLLKKEDVHGLVQCDRDL